MIFAQTHKKITRVYSVQIECMTQRGKKRQSGQCNVLQKTIETNLMNTNLLPYLPLTENHRTGKTISNSNFYNHFSNIHSKYNLDGG